MAADIGWVLHWTLSDIERLSIPELGRYHGLAIERLKPGRRRG